jgi:pyridoxal phosphate enzyme (YggS family)
MEAERITEGVAAILSALPDGVTLIGAVKTRTPEEVAAAVRGGLRHIGHNYVQEAERMRAVLPSGLVCHLIGHLQRSKVKKAVGLFDVVETLDSLRLAEEMERRCGEIDRVLPVLIEVNSGRETNKSGALPEDVPALVEQLAGLPHLRLEGLMTMGPDTGDPELARPYFQTTRRLFETLAVQARPGPALHTLSMGMSNSYRVALEEGANVIRLGTLLFGPREE